MTQPPDDAALVAAAKLAVETFYGNDWQWAALNSTIRQSWYDVVEAVRMSDEGSRAALEPSDKGVGR